MFTDSLGNPITAKDGSTAAKIDDFVMGFLAYQARAVNVLAAAQHDPACALANAYAALLCMFLEAPEGPGQARGFLESAEAAAGGATERERLTVALTRAWVDGDIAEVLRLGDDITERYPRDLFVAKLHQYHNFNRGDAPAMLRMAHKVFETNRDVAYVHGMRAFAYEQCHRLDAAEADARAALTLDPAEPWAHHALAHVMLSQGRIDEGRAFMESVSHHWAGLNSFMYTHNWWHLGLFALSQGDTESALAIHDRHVWGIDKSYTQDQVGAVSFLARLDLAGVDVGERWAELGAHLVGRAQDTVIPFLTMQYLYGLARAGREEADSLMRAVRHKADTAAPFEHSAWAEVALPACEGLLAHARGDVDRAVHGLGAALPKMQEIGGSHAQRDLFEQIHLDALMRSGRLVMAQQKLEERRAFDPDGVPLNRALAVVYDRLGLPMEASVARARADATLAKHGQPAAAAE